MKLKYIFPICAALITVAAAPRGGAAGFTLGDWYVHTGEFSWNYQSGAFSTPVQITLTRTGSEIRADRADGNTKTKQASLNGNVWLQDRNGVLTNFAGGSAGGNKQATLTCDTLQIDGITKIYTAIGHVHFTQGGSFATADRAIMNGLTHDLHLYGNVTLHQ